MVDNVLEPGATDFKGQEIHDRCRALMPDSRVDVDGSIPSRRQFEVSDVSFMR